MSLRTLRNWAQAARLPSHIKILFPLFYGQAFAFAQTGRFDVSMGLLLWVYAGLEQVYIVFWNDFADAQADVANEEPTLFSGGSRVIPERKISRKALFVAGGLAALGILLIGLTITLGYQRLWTLPMFVAGLALLWMYSFPPIKLNYRGMGEVLQGLGCGVLLPMVGYYCQVGSLSAFPWLFLIPFFLFHTTSSIATSLPDAPADRKVIKRTIPVLIGNVRAGWLVNGLIIAGLLFTTWLIDPMASMSVLVLSLIVPAAFVVYNMSLTAKLGDCRVSVFRYGGLVILLCVSYALGFCLSAFAAW